MGAHGGMVHCIGVGLNLGGAWACCPARRGGWSGSSNKMRLSLCVRVVTFLAVRTNTNCCISLHFAVFNQKFDHEGFVASLCCHCVGVLVGSHGANSGTRSKNDPPANIWIEIATLISPAANCL